MNFTYQDRGEYFRGLLVLIGKDNIISQDEREKIIEIGIKFGFEKSFCKEAVSDLLENQFISMEAPHFSRKEIAEKFLDDAIYLSLIDNDFHIDELEWLEEVAQRNGINNNVLDAKIKNQLFDYRSSRTTDIGKNV